MSRGPLKSQRSSCTYRCHGMSSVGTIVRLCRTAPSLTMSRRYNHHTNRFNLND